MSRAYRAVRPKANRVYSVPDVLELYGVCRNTVSNWVSSGLRHSNETGPQLFRGAELKRFHGERQARTKAQLRFGEFKCLGCKAAVFPISESLQFSSTNNGTMMAWADCPDCAGKLRKLLGDTESNILKKYRSTNTSLVQGHEDNGGNQAGNGKIGCKLAEKTTFVNDQRLFEWQIYAGRNDGKTVDAHLAAIREFEVFIAGKAFETATMKDVAAYRDDLIRRGTTDCGTERLSTSSIRHKASHLASFFTWLCMQDGCRRMKRDIPSYFALPRRLMAKALSSEIKPYPTMDESVRMTTDMPARTLIDRRDRTIVAMAFVSGLRAGALISLRRKHLQIDGKCVEQNAQQMRAKNGKSYRVDWFPRTEPMQVIVIAWCEELAGMGFEAEDTLFPAADQLRPRDNSNLLGHTTIDPMKTESVVSAAFKKASKGIGADFTPHSARHCLKALGDQLCTTAERRKAWSLNLGHASEITTEVYYGKMTEQHRKGVLSELRSQRINTDEEKDLMLDFYQYKLTPGTIALKTAKKLIEKRAGSDDGDLLE